MGRYFIMAIMLYALVVGIYLLWEHGVKRRWNAGRKKGNNPFKPSAKEDIIGKSNFVLGQGRTKDTTLEISDKSEEKHSTFADGNEQTHVQDTPGATPAAEVENVVLPEPAEDNSGDIDIVIENEPEGEIESDEDDAVDYDETEEAGETSGSGKALGLGFDDLSGAIRMVDNAEGATQEEREEAGRVLVEVRKTELFGQVGSDEPKKKIVSSLMDDYFNAYYRDREAQPQPAVKAPTDFNVRSFA
jgi:hypothetical protein